MENENERKETRKERGKVYFVEFTSIIHLSVECIRAKVIIIDDMWRANCLRKQNNIRMRKITSKWGKSQYFMFKWLSFLHSHSHDMTEPNFHNKNPPPHHQLNQQSRTNRLFLTVSCATHSPTHSKTIFSTTIIILEYTRHGEINYKSNFFFLIVVNVMKTS